MAMQSERAGGEFVKPGEPVREIPTDSPQETPEPGIALCLSGGGYRAMLFHLGALWRLNEFGYLPKLERISSVSGGSITSGALAMNWTRLDFDSSGVARAFNGSVVQPVRAIASTTIDFPAVLTGFVTLGRLGALTGGFYDRALYHGTTLDQLPIKPRFVFNATSLQSGVLWRFSKPYMRDYRVGNIANPRVALATAVAASSAFPPFLSPVILRTRESDFDANSGYDLQRPPFTQHVLLTDGGVYDNLGLETAWKRYDTILVSDGSAHIGAEESPKRNWFGQTYRVLMLIDAQVGSLRKRQVIDGFNRKTKKGTYWGIASHIDDYGVAQVLSCPPDATARLAAFETRLRRVSDRMQQALINWGYAVSDAALRRHIDPTLPPPGAFPYPGVGVQP
jgi:NTE family protein